MKKEQKFKDLSPVLAKQKELLVIEERMPFDYYLVDMNISGDWLLSKG